ncbi:DUF1593 domain-containing protein [Novosphingobium sp. P6W]|uniref:DUF1593 domain-containing protein n=1 Tax=Novosphingobium sp. P6W TaxID=1609758 RepID=UPI000699214F|nr:DUF1593 domain-containing protein [Novosphingobium sp. P6W]
MPSHHEALRPGPLSRAVLPAFAACLMAACAAPALAAPLPAEHLDTAEGKPRLFVLSDIGNEPDDQMSLVRLLLYSNEIDIEGLVATTSTFQKSVTHSETIRAIVADFGKVRPRLLDNAPGWPTAQALAETIASGPAAYGVAAIDAASPSEGARKLIAAADRADTRPLWVDLWGGANTLAEALAHVRATRSAEELARFVARLRVYAISDQDDAGPSIRREFPDLFWIGSPSTPDSGDFAKATWTGISGDKYYLNGEGADFTTVTNEWLGAHIRKGPLGAHYPRYWFIMEGDTPAFLGLIDNGLEARRSPSWGGWGGRYVMRQPYGESRPLWTQGGDMFYRIASQDTVEGADGRPHTSDQATIWRWRTAFQNDFAARMDWTVKPFAQANHAPRIAIEGSAGTGVVERTVRKGEVLHLDAGASTDPDGQKLTYRWFLYNEAGVKNGERPADLTLSQASDAKVAITARDTCTAGWLPDLAPPCPASGKAHVILAVTDGGSPAITRYRRVIVTVTQAKRR